MTALVHWGLISRTVVIIGTGILLAMIIGGLVITWARTLKRLRMGEDEE